MAKFLSKFANSKNNKNNSKYIKLISSDSRNPLMPYFEKQKPENYLPGIHKLF